MIAKGGTHAKLRGSATVGHLLGDHEVKAELYSTVLAGLLIVAAACAVEAPPAAKESGTGQGRSEVAFQLSERDLIPEGICYDRDDDVFFLGSMRKSKILRISRDGSSEMFVAPTAGEDRGYLGMRIDPDRRLLWANWHQEPKPGEQGSKRTLWTGISKFDLEDGSLVSEYMVEKTGENSIRIRTFERGVEDETLSSGTGATASAAIARKLGLTGDVVEVGTRGGSLTISLKGGVRMQGPAATVFTGMITF